MSDYLPFDVQCEVFKLLPIKSLLRCTAVCKSWYSFITNPTFIYTHFNHAVLCNQNDAQSLILKYFDPNVKDKNFTICQRDGTVYKFTYLGYPFKIPFGFTRIVGSCMGLVCLLNDDLNSTILWNSLIRKFVEIGLTKKAELPHLFVLGFGFCPVTFDPKIVKIQYPNRNKEEFSVPPQVEIYALGSGTWKSVPCYLPPYSMIEIMWSQVFLNGAIHWVASDKRGEGKNRSLVMSFDLVNETFHEIELPKDLADEHLSNLFLAIYKEELCVLQYPQDTDVIAIWVMREYRVLDSCTRLYRFNLSIGKPAGFFNKSTVKHPGYGKEGVIWIAWNGNLLVSYGSSNGEIKELNPDCDISSFYADAFMENLLLLNGQNWVREEEKQIAD